MHDGIQYDPIQGQVQDHEPLEVGNSAIFKPKYSRSLGFCCWSAKDDSI